MSTGSTDPPRPPSRGARYEGSVLAQLARMYPERYMAYVFGLEPRAHHLAWWHLLVRLLNESATARHFPAVPLPDGFGLEAMRERADPRTGEAEPAPVAAPRLYVVAPPGHAKSTLFSQVFPCWYLGLHPDQTLLMFTS